MIKNEVIQKHGTAIFYRTRLDDAKKSRLTVLVTGTLGGGKSTLCEELAAYGCTTILADNVAKEMIWTRENQHVLVEILGATILHTANGKTAYNFDVIRHLLFDREKRDLASARRQWIHDTFGEPILHEVQRRVQHAHEEGQRIVCVENATALEEGWMTALPADITVCVLSSDKLSQERLTVRGVDPTTLREIATSQFPGVKKAKYSGVVIVNNGSEEDLRITAGELYIHLNNMLDFK